MKTGDLVMIYPHGDSGQSWPAHVEILSRNGVSIAVTFDRVPPFLVTRDGVSVHMPTGRIIMMLMRTEVDGKPWGPWVEVFHGGHYEIEARCQ